MAKKKIFHNSDKDIKIDSIGKTIQYLYYRFSEFYKRKEGSESFYKLSAFLLLSVLFAFNVATIICFLIATDLQEYFYKRPKFQPYLLERAIYGGGGLLLISILTYLLLGRKPYQDIYSTYNKEPYSQRVKRGRLIVLYIITTFILFAISGYVMEQNRSEEWKKEHRKEVEIPKIRIKLPKKNDTIR